VEFFNKTLDPVIALAVIAVADTKPNRDRFI